MFDSKFDSIQSEDHTHTPDTNTQQVAKKLDDVCLLFVTIFFYFCVNTTQQQLDNIYSKQNKYTTIAFHATATATITCCSIVMIVIDNWQ